VLLVEAGGRDRYPWIHIPVGYHKLFTHDTLNWKFESEPVAGLNGRTSYQPRGKMLGGTSSLNGRVYMRGTAADYDGWRQMGCVGWDYQSVLPFFKKAEDQERGEDEFHGVGGPLKVTDQRFKHEIIDAIIEAAIQAGIPRNPDFNGAAQEGVGYYQATVGGGRRWSTSVAYLRPARGRRNLVVTPNAIATRILIENGRAAGLEYRTENAMRTALWPRRDHHFRRRLRIAAAPAAVGHRTRRTPEGNGSRRGPRLAAGGCELARPFQHLRCVAVDQSRHAK
jgi:choline dehydrogenase